MSPRKEYTFKISRKKFLKIAGMAAASLSISKDSCAGAFIGRKWRHFSGRQEPERWIYSTCGYCAVGCGMYIGIDKGKVVTVKGDPDSSVNEGRLCQKGIWEHQALYHPDRLTRPLLRKQGGKFSKEGKLGPVSWDEALEAMKDQFTKYPRDRTAVLSSGQLLTEEVYALGKLVRVGLRTPHFDGNTTLCMASAAAGYVKSFGTDGPPGCYDDFNHADMVLVIGSNMSECHPIIFYLLDKGRQKNRFFLIAVDPRRTQLARHADLHLPIKPGTDNVLLYGIARFLIDEGLINKDFVDNHTDGFEELKSSLASFTLNTTSRITGISAEKIQFVARNFASMPKVLTCWSPAINQSVHGVSNITAVNNLHLLTGKIGKPGCAPFSITGQCNAMGGRELDGKGKTLPGYRFIVNPAHRKEVADFWGIDESILPEKPGYSHTEIINAAGKGDIDAIWIICTNPVVSVPDRNHVIKCLKRTRFLAVQDIFPTPTTELADLVLPAAMWSEKTGMMTNSERRINFAQKAKEPPGEAMADFEIFLKAAERFGFNSIFKGWKSTEDALREIREITKRRPCDYSGINYEKLQRLHGVQWPVPDMESNGTARLYSDFKFNTETGRAHLVPVMDIPQVAEPTDAEFDFTLNTGRVLEHWHTSTKTGRIQRLNGLVPEAFVEINPIDAKRLGIRNKDKVRITSRRGEIALKARVTSIISPGSIFVPFFDPDIPVNNLTINSLDAISKQPNFKQCAVKIHKMGVA